MKRIMVFWLVLLLPIFAFAQEYHLQDINFKIDISDDYTVLTRDNLDNNINLDKLNITKDNLINIMETNNIYLDIVKNDLVYEILVVVPKTNPSFTDLSKANSIELDMLKKTIVKETGDNVPIVYKNNYSFIVVDYYDKNMDMNVINYYTVVNSHGYNIQLQTKSEITDEYRNELKMIVDSIRFDNINENVDDNNQNSNKPFDFKIIIYGLLAGLLAGLITYYFAKNIKIKKSSK